MKNPVVPATIACVFVIYSVLLVTVMKLDQHDDRKSDIVRLVDNSPFDRQKYYVSLETGFRKGAGTTAQVCLLYIIIMRIIVLIRIIIIYHLVQCLWCCHHDSEVLCVTGGGIQEWSWHHCTGDSNNDKK